jgi:hypothetical protein
MFMHSYFGMQLCGIPVNLCVSIHAPQGSTGVLLLTGQRS